MLPPPVASIKAVPLHWPSLITSSGDRVVANSYGSRAITVFQGEGPEVRTIISTRSYSHVIVHGRVVIYVPLYPEYEGSAGASVIAVDTTTGNRLWEIEQGIEIHGLTAGEDFLYISEEEHLRVVEPTSGRIVWRKNLPRLRGRSSVVEHDERVFVNCDFVGDDPPQYFLYCLNAKTGHINWTRDPGFIPFLFRDGKIYTYTEPTRLMNVWRHVDVMESYDVSKTPKWHEDRSAHVRQRLGSKTQEEIELNLRAWHALGDRSGLIVLQTVAEVRPDQKTQELARSLGETFPKVRDPMRLMDFLENQFDQHAELRAEIRRILEDFNPVPFWMEEKNQKYNSYRRKPIPQFELAMDQRRLIDAFRKLKGRADVAPLDPSNREALNELMLGRGSATLESLVAVHDASDDPQHRMLVRTAIYKQHPARGSDWALKHLDKVSLIEISLWVQLASIDWLLDHEELYLTWMFHEEDGSVQSFASRRLGRLDDPTPVIPFCVRLLRERISGAPKNETEALLSAIHALGKSRDARHANLLRRFLTYKSTEEDQKETFVRDAAYKALKDIGQEVPVSAVLPPAISAAPAGPSASDGESEDIQDDMIRLRMALGNEDDTRARQLALRILTIIEGKSANPDIREVAEWSLVDVYEALEEWDKAIELLRKTESGFVNEDSLLTIYEKAGRWHDIIDILETSTKTESVIRAAFILARKGKSLERSLELLRRELNKHPNDPNICIAMTLVHFKRDEMQAADAMMERAIALQPRPEGSHLFAQTFIHWLKREKPENAIAWLKQSFSNDRQIWERDDLLGWVSQFPELKGTAEELRQNKQ